MTATLAISAVPSSPPSRATTESASGTAGGVWSDGATDEALMGAYMDGDAAAFRLLFRRLAPRIHAFFLRYFRSPAVADDLLQTTFLKVHAARHTFDTSARVRPWVFTIAARVRLDELRRRYRLPRTTTEDTVLDAVLVSDMPDAPDLMERDERAVRIRAAVDALPEGQRVVIHLHRFEGMTFGEVAQILGLKEGAVRVRAFRGYERLRKSLGDLLEAPADADTRAAPSATVSESVSAKEPSP